MALDQQQLIHTDNVGDAVRLDDYVSQTFKAGLSGELTSLKLWIAKVNSPDELVIEIRTLSGTEPSGTILATSDDILPASINVHPGNEITANFSSPPTLVSGTSYAIVCTQKSDGGSFSDRYIVYGKSSANPYIDGQVFFTYNGGSSWNSASVQDAYFQTFVTTPLSETDSFSLTDSVDITENSHIVDLEDSFVLSDEFQIGDIIGEDALGLSDEISLSPSHTVNLEEIFALGDTGALNTFIENASSIIYHAPSTLYIITDTDPVNLIVVTINSGDVPSFIGYTLEASGESFKNAKDITINETSNYIYIAGADGQVMKVAISDINTREQIDLQDTNNLLNIDNYNSFDITYNNTDDTDGEIITLDERITKVFNSDFRINRKLHYFLTSRINYIKAKIVNCKMNFLYNQIKAIRSDFRFTTAPDPSILEPMPRNDWSVLINNVEITDADLATISVIYNIDQDFTNATFILARYHDSPNLTLSGGSSEITNHNYTIIKFNNRIVFDGEISELNLSLGAKGQEQLKVNCLSNAYTVNKQTPSGNIHASWSAIRNYYKKLDLIDTETEIVRDSEGNLIEVRITPGDEIDTASLRTKYTNARNTFKSNIVNLPLAKKTVQRHPYDVVLNNIDIDTNPIDPNSKNPNKFNGIRIDTGISEWEWVWRTHSSIDEASGQLINPVGGNAGNDPLVLGGELSGSLGTQRGNTLVDLINSGRFQPYPDYTYFWYVDAYKYATEKRGDEEIEVKRNVTFTYIGTSLDPITSDNWIVTKAQYYRQRIDNNWVLPSEGWVVQDTGEVLPLRIRMRTGVFLSYKPQTYHYIGSEPFKEVSSDKKDSYHSKMTLVDREDGLWREQRRAYFFISYAREIGQIEFAKLKNINGDLNKDTVANIELTLDGYFYYSLGLLTQINLVNTTETNVFSNNNGFPLAIKSIELNSSSMKATLSIDNQLSNIDLDVLDTTKPRWQGYEIYWGSRRWLKKFNLATFTYTD